MNNFSNMNYFMPGGANDFSYLNEMQNVNNWETSKENNKMMVNPNQNLNFNKCNFNGKTTPNELFDVYNGYIRGNMFPNLYNQYKINRPYDIEPLNKQAELLTQLNAYGFAAHDINLYLDTHPNDKQMINLYNKYIDETNKLVRTYEKEYGPLNVSGNMTSPWSWNNDPWPWENN